MISPSSSSRGYALVITLAIVALIFAFAIFLLSSAGWERKSAASFRSAISTRQLADTAAGVVQGQINAASTQGGEVSWTSQPGMIRTFDPKGKLLKGYKLYSATDMVVDTIDLASDLPPGTWSSSPAIWTDLNAPVEISGVKYYPILDPSAIGTSDSPQGLAINSAPGVSAASYQQAPMPVKWLYLLRNGELATATTNASNQAIVAAATTDNPIVGRIAFWTDDETTKVNINTASEGTYWDTPRLMTKQEQDFANYQPAQREFQRYPGHPATTSLSSVFPSLTPQQIFNITPKVIGGGSNAGTQVATGPLDPDPDRLYADVGELIFDSKRNTNSGLSKTQVEQARFCLTAVSRAPEVNMFNLPRVAAWPIHEGVDQDHTTAFDRLIAFCSSIGDQPYYFQRSQADSTTHDISIARNADLFEYLQKLTSLDIPGYGGNFLTKYNADRNQILTEIFDYIRSTNLYDDNLAAGNQFTKGRSANKMVGPAHGWVAPSVNTDGTLGLGRAFTLSEFGIAFICNAVADDPDTSADESSGSNIPTGPGANAVLGGTALNDGEKYIQAILIPEFFSAMQGYTVMWPQMSVRIKGLNTLSITRNGVTSALFPSGMTEAVSINGTNPNALTSNRNFGGYCDWRYALVSPAATTPTTPYGSPARGNLPADTGDTYPFIGVPIKITAPATGGTMRFNGGDLTVEIYAVNSVTPASTDLVQTIAIKLPAEDFPIPSLVTGSLPAPSYGTADTSAKQSWWTFRKDGSVSGNVGRLSYAAQDPGQYQQLRTGQFLRKDGDVLRTVMPAHGDYRLVAGQQSVPDTVFIPHRYYSDTTKSLASNFIGGSGSHVFAGYDMDTKYLSNLYYGDSFAPDIPGNASLANRPESTGDYDTGISNYMDGPFINKPDEGDSNRGSSGAGIPYFSENWTQILLGSTFFSPNRLIPSPGMFGSLPTGVQAGVPWRTLLFRPQANHFGSTSPKDSLLMDLFWMPVVEPYAISDRFSTAGKINMNYQILPFTYIERSTGLQALLKSERVMAIPDKEPTSGQSNVFTYKKYNANPNAYNYRMEIDPAETLSQFTKVFSAGDVFRSASDICDLYMVPKGQSLSTLDTFWAKNRLTGDNLREKVYTTLYPRLTTKSNTYTVHLKVQALRKKPGSSPTIWQEGVDEVLGEYRGATVIERFIDASNPDIPDYATATSQIGTSSLKTLDTFYKWRTISNRQFAP